MSDIAIWGALMMAGTLPLVVLAMWAWRESRHERGSQSVGCLPLLSIPWALICWIAALVYWTIR